MKACVLIPSRERKNLAQTAIQSVKRTSAAEVFLYTDDDTTPYEIPGCTEIRGPRIGMAQALNQMACTVGCEFDLIAMLTDDAVMITQGWDIWALQYVGKPLVISPRVDRDGPHRVDMPAVTPEWIKAVGWYIHPEMHHYCWPSVIGLLSEGLCLIRATDKQFGVQHNNVSGLNKNEFEADAVQFYGWAVWHYDLGKETLANKLGMVRP